MAGQRADNVTTMPINDALKEVAAYEQQAEKAGRKRRIAAIVILSAAVIAAGVLLILSRIKHDSFTVESVSGECAAGGSYEIFAGGFIRCTQSGISCFDTEFNTVWDEGLSMSDPQLTFSGNYGLVYDRGANEAMLFDELGKKTEINCALTISLACISENGVTAFGVSDGSASKILFYDIDGNCLDIEVKNVMSETDGYPIDMALSPSGTKLALSLVCTAGSSLGSKIVFIDFEADSEVTDRITASFEYNDTVFAELACIGDDEFAAFGDNRLAFFDASGDKPELYAELPQNDKIRSVLSGEGFAGIIAAASSGGNVLKLFNKKGAETFELCFEYDYDYAKVSEDRILIFGGDTNLIVTKGGVVKYEGSFTEKLCDMLSFGFDNYLLCGDFGMRIIHLK